MKKIYSFFLFLVIGFSATASPDHPATPPPGNGYGGVFTFVERGVEFAVYPDGQFDFFYNSRGTGYSLNVISPHLNISYNSGYNYDPFVQYDDFGAVIQIENVPVFYDHFGRIVQAGNVNIFYNHFGMVSRIGNLFLHYNPYRQLSHYTGYINFRNRYYTPRPWHRYYSPPKPHLIIVYDQPYRAYYRPHRVKYKHHKSYYASNHNKSYRKRHYRPGDPITSFQRGKRTSQIREVRNDQRTTSIRTRRSSNESDNNSNRTARIQRVQQSEGGRTTRMNNSSISRRTTESSKVRGNQSARKTNATPTQRSRTAPRKEISAPNQKQEVGRSRSSRVPKVSSQRESTNSKTKRAPSKRMKVSQRTSQRASNIYSNGNRKADQTSSRVSRTVKPAISGSTVNKSSTNSTRGSRKR